MYATRATIHTTLKAAPMQLVFGRDAVLNTKFEADWKYIKIESKSLSNKIIKGKMLNGQDTTTK
jgi:hypothetical protein